MSNLWHTIHWIVIDGLPKEERKTMFHMPGDEQTKMKKLEAFEFLKSARLYWDNKTEELMLSEGVELAPLSENAYYDFLFQGMDMAGSPGHDEQQVINMMKVSYPWLPRVLFRQLEKFRLIGRELKGWSEERKIGIRISKDGEAEMSEGMKKELNRKKYHKSDDNVLVLH